MARPIEASLNWDQQQTLAPLQLLLRPPLPGRVVGRGASGRTGARAALRLDLAIIGSYRLACGLDVRVQANALLAGFRAVRLVTGACPEPPPHIGVPPDEPTG